MLGLVLRIGLVVITFLVYRNFNKGLKQKCKQAFLFWSFQPILIYLVKEEAEKNRDDDGPTLSSASEMVSPTAEIRQTRTSYLSQRFDSPVL
jgi:hypothetical protein